jgi:transposase
MGEDRAAAATGRPAGWSLARPPHRDQRDPVEAAHWRAPWRDLPERYVRWRRDGTWDRLLAHAQTKSDAIGEVEWTVSVDSSVVRAHQHAAGARRAASRADRKGTAPAV